MGRSKTKSEITLGLRGLVSDGVGVFFFHGVDLILGRYGQLFGVKALVVKVDRVRDRPSYNIKNVLLLISANHS